MDHKSFAQLLGNYGEFVGAIAVVVTLGCQPRGWASYSASDNQAFAWRTCGSCPSASRQALMNAS